MKPLPVSIPILLGAAAGPFAQTPEPASENRVCNVELARELGADDHRMENRCARLTRPNPHIHPVWDKVRGESKFSSSPE